MTVTDQAQSYPVSVEQIMKDYRYDEEDRQMVTNKLHAAVQILKNGGAYEAENQLVGHILSIMVGFMIENRDGINQEFMDITSFPLSLQGLINSIRYNKKEEAE